MQRQRQQFRCGDKIVNLEVQGDTPPYHSAMDDIIIHFPLACRFRVGDDEVVFLKDKSGERYKPWRIRHYPDECVDVINRQDSYSLQSPPSSAGSINIDVDVYNTHEPNLSASSIASSIEPLNVGVHNAHHRTLSASSIGGLNVGVYKTHHRNLSANSIASSYISPAQTSRSRSPSASESLPTPLSSPSSSSPSIPFAFRCVSPADKGMMSLRSPPDSFQDGRSSPFLFFPDYAECSEYSEYDIPEPVSHYSLTTRQAHGKQVASMFNIMELVNQFKELKHEVRMANSKLHKEEMHRQTLDQLKVVQRRVDAALTQNFELHEYPIPRLFVILPEKKRDKSGKSFFEIIKTKNLLQEKFRLHFLCECGEQTCGDNYNLDTSGPGKMDKNHPDRIHLADHEGYEISRPNKFFEQYGPYVLGVLRVLQACVGAASIVAPPLVHVQTALDSMARVTETVTKNTLDAVTMSIDYLQTNLSQEALLESFELNSENPEQSATSLKALEGADLRRLDTFLRNKDQDKILGKLYRVTTSKGHVKWVCLEHYEYSYKAMAMASFIELVKTYRGVYEQYLCKVTITLPNSNAADDFFDRLKDDGDKINELDLTLKWVFTTLDLQQIVRAICRSKIKFLKMDLSDRRTRLDPTQTENRYRPLIDLFSNRDLQTLSLQGIISFGYRTGDLPASFQSSSLRTYQHLNGIGAKDTSKIAHILSLCPKLVDLRLGSELASIIDDGLCEAIGSLHSLEVLHLWNFKTRDDHPVKGLLSNVINGTKHLRELVVINTPVESWELQAVVETFSRTLEVLILDPIYSEFNLATIIRKEPAQPAYKPAPVPSSKSGMSWRNSTQQRPALQATPHPVAPFSKLRQLHLNTDLSDDSSQSLARIMPRLSLTHFGLYKNIPMDAVISATDFSTVRSVYFCKFTGADLIPMWKSFPEFGGSNKIESVSLERVRSPGTRLVRDCLAKIAIKRLWIGGVKSIYLKQLFSTMDLSKLEVLAIVNCEYTWDVEAILAKRHVDISDKLRVFVACNNQCSDIGDPNTYKEDARNGDTDCYARLRPHQVWTDTSVNDMNLRHKLMVRME
ncbi:hypothetical protein BGZ95_004813 [Linnemannia exigua]|uniref:RNI-like protein n=1 Tax=Linnemannia exigua TaxID=604196 RepID=A0AAD4DH46_9FUNG|nr:hypothetical protein BGZ95_004813 [Linnemannia exigua]